MVHAMQVAVVPRAKAESLRKELHRLGAMDPSVKIVKRGDHVLLPLHGPPSVDLAAFDAHLETLDGLEARPRTWDPQEILTERFDRAGIPREGRPRRWERFGDVVAVQLQAAAKPYATDIGRIFGETLRARTVVESVAPIRGPMRTPDVRVLWGDGTETVHVEGGVRYRFDVARIMFSSGNLAERVGIASLARSGDVVVDLFAGIGYFALPIVVHGNAERVYACEVNPVAFQYLLENLRLNRVSNAVPLLGDCRETAPAGVADMVLMGHFDAIRYLDVAFRCLRSAGTIVYHEICPKERYPEDPLRHVSEGARAAWFRVLDTRTRIVKSYAPGIVHALVVARVGPAMRRTRGRSTPSRPQRSGRLDRPKGLSGRRHSGRR